MNLQVIASPSGDILWVSGALPGSVHDKKAEWIWGVLAELEAAGLVTLADKGYQGSRYAKIPYRGKNKRSPKKTPTERTRNSAHPENERTPSSRPGVSSVSSAAAPGAPVSLPRPSTYCRFARHNQDGKGSLRANLMPFPEIWELGRQRRSGIAARHRHGAIGRTVHPAMTKKMPLLTRPGLRATP